MNLYTEDHLVEQPAMELMQSIGWETKNCYEEAFVKEGTLGRETTSKVVLTRYLCDAIKRINPHVGFEAIDLAIEEITKDRSSLSPVSANYELYKLLKDGVPVTYRDDYDEEVDGKVYVSLSEKIRALTPTANINHVLADIEEVLDLSIDAEGYLISDDTEDIVDLSGLDFEKMRRNIDKKHKNTELQKLKTKIEKVISDMVVQNKTRTNYLERFEKMIEEYNSGSKNVDIIYKNLIDLAETLSEEQKRHMQENLTEEQLALFDILTKPELELTEKDKQQVKITARQLLETLKNEKLVLDWRKKQQARAEVLYTIEKVLDDDLPRSFSTDLYRKKCELVYQHIYDNYYGDGRSVYDVAS